MPPDEPTENNQPPFNPATPPQGDNGKLDDTHPATDSGSDIQPEEVYEEGIAGATGATEPNAGNAVTGYTPPPDDDPEDLAI